MSDRVRGAIAIIVGGFALWQSYMLYQAHRVDWRLWVELVAGLVLILIGVWRMSRKATDPTAELLK